MRSFDLSPLFRSTIGFDRLADMLDSVSQYDASQAYPPYNIERTDEHHYAISLAVAGSAENDLNIEVREGVLSIRGKRDSGAEKTHYLHQGIAGRSFERRFQLAENVEVRGARLENGLLHIALERVVPEGKKPRRVGISTGETRDPKIVDTAQKAA